MTYDTNSGKSMPPLPDRGLGDSPPSEIPTPAYFNRSTGSAGDLIRPGVIGAHASARLRSLDPDLPGMVMAIRAGLIAGLIAAVILCVVSGKGIWPILISWAGGAS